MANGPITEDLLRHRLEDCRQTIHIARWTVERARELCRMSEETLATSRDVLTTHAAHRSRWLTALDSLSRNDPSLEGFLDLAVEMTEADFGNIQLLDGKGLRIAAQRGCKADFLKYFSVVNAGASACGAALLQKRRVVVANVNTEVSYGARFRQVLLNADMLACQSTPLISSAGHLVGMLSTHYRTPRTPPFSVLPYLNRLALRAADLLASGVLVANVGP